MVPFRPEFIAYVNLDHRTDRRAHMERLLKDAPCPVERIPATRLDGTPEAHGIGMANTYEGQIGTASCYLSHKRALERALEVISDGPFAVLEDDIHFDDHLWRRDIGLHLLPDDWEVVCVSPRFRNRKPKFRDWLAPRVGLSAQTFTQPISSNRPVAAKKLTPRYIITGSHFMLFRTRSAIERVLAKMAPLRDVRHVDLFYIEEFRTYVVKGKGIRAGDFGTDLFPNT